MPSKLLTVPQQVLNYQKTSISFMLDLPVHVLPAFLSCITLTCWSCKFHLLKCVTLVKALYQTQYGINGSFPWPPSNIGTRQCELPCAQSTLVCWSLLQWSINSNLSLALSLVLKKRKPRVQLQSRKRERKNKLKIHDLPLKTIQDSNFLSNLLNFITIEGASIQYYISSCKADLLKCKIIITISYTFKFS